MRTRMKYCLPLLCLVLLLSACGRENPKTKNELLRNKVIGWDHPHAGYFELHADGTLIGVGGEWPQEGYVAGQWESVDENGSFKIVSDPTRADSGAVVRMSSRLGQGVKFTLEEAGGTREYSVKRYGAIETSHAKSATRYRAEVHLSKFAEETYIQDMLLADPDGKIKKVSTAGDKITNEVMTNNAKRWRITPLIIVSKGKAPDLPLRAGMTLEFFDGKSEKLTFVTDRIKDRGGEVYQDSWF